MANECAPSDNTPADVCSHLKTCPMFSAFETESAGKIFRMHYCHSKYTDCMRYQKSSRGESVSPMLLPNGAMLKAR